MAFTPSVPNPLRILYPNGSVMGVQVFVWDVNTLSPILWDGSVNVGSITIGSVDQGVGGVSPWLVTGPLTNAELRASAVPVSLAVTPGDATAANQVIGNASLSSVDTKLTSQATAAKQDSLLAELQLKADLTETQPVSLLVAPSTPVTNAFLPNLDVALSTRTKPADQQHTIIDSGTTAVTQPTGTNLHTVTDTGSTTAVTGTVTTKETRAATPTQTSVSVLVTDTVILAANAARLGATLYNESGAIAYVKLGGAASLTSYSVQMAIGSYYEVPFDYTGGINGITVAITAVMRATELTA